MNSSKIYEWNINPFLILIILQSLNNWKSDYIFLAVFKFNFKFLNLVWFLHIYQREKTIFFINYLITISTFEYY